MKLELNENALWAVLWPSVVAVLAWLIFNVRGCTVAEIDADIRRDELCVQNGCSVIYNGCFCVQPKEKSP